METATGFFASSPIIMFLVPIILILVVVLALFKKINTDENSITASALQKEATSVTDTNTQETVPEYVVAEQHILESTTSEEHREISTTVEPLPLVIPIIQEGTVTTEVLDAVPMKQEMNQE